MDNTIFQSIGIAAEALLCWSVFRLAFKPVSALSSASSTELQLIADYGAGCAALTALFSADINLLVPLSTTAKIISVLAIFFCFQRSREILHKTAAFLDDKGEELYVVIKRSLTACCSWWQAERLDLLNSMTDRADRYIHQVKLSIKKLFTTDWTEKFKRDRFSTAIRKGHALEAVRSCTEACHNSIPSAANLEQLSEIELYGAFEDLIEFLLTDDELGTNNLVKEEDRHLIPSILGLIKRGEVDGLHKAARQALAATQRHKYYPAMMTVVFAIASLQEPSSLGYAVRSLFAGLYQREIQSAINDATQQSRFLSQTELLETQKKVWMMIADKLEELLNKRVTVGHAR